MKGIDMIDVCGVIFFGWMSIPLHEVGHLVAAKAFGIRARWIDFKSVYVEVKPGQRPRAMIAVCAAGPLLQLALFLTLAYWWPFVGFSLACIAPLGAFGDIQQIRAELKALRG